MVLYVRLLQPKLAELPVEVEENVRSDAQNGPERAHLECTGTGS